MKYINSSSGINFKGTKSPTFELDYSNEDSILLKGEAGKLLIRTKDDTQYNSLIVLGVEAIGQSIFHSNVIINGNISSSGGLFWDNTDGRLGIGTTTPDKQLSIYADGSAQFNLRGVFNTSGFNTFFFQRGRGTLTSPTALQVNDEIGGFSWGGYTSTYWSGSRAGVFGSADGNWTDAGQPTRLSFQTTTISSLAERMRITSGGLIGIGANSLNPIGQLEVSSDLASRTPLIVKGALGQSASFAQILNSAGGTVFDFQSTGSLISNVDAGVFAPSVIFSRANTTPGAGATFFVQRARGTLINPSAVLNGDTLGYFRATGYQNGAYRVGSQFDFIVDEAPSGSVIPTGIVFRSSLNGTDTNYLETVKISSKGQFTIQRQAETGIREVILKSSITDDTTSQFGIANGTNNDAWFMPTFYGFANYNTANVIAMKFTGYILAAKDVTSDIAVINWQAYVTSSSIDPNNGTGSKIANKPLFSLLNFLDKVLLISPNGSQAIGSNRTTLATAQVDIINALSTQPIIKLQLAGLTQSANALEIRNSNGVLITGFSGNGAFQPSFLNDLKAPNNSQYFSLNQNKLCYKDNSGNIHALY